MPRDPVAANDRLIARIIRKGWLRVDFESGNVYATRANDPDKPAGAPTKKGYIRINIYISGRGHAIMAHRVVWIAAHGVPKGDARQINHIDTVKSHNWLSNLELATNAGNMQHASRSGLLLGPRGERAPRSRLNRRQVRKIRIMLKSGFSHGVLGDIYKVSSASIYAIATGKSWAWLDAA